MWERAITKKISIQNESKKLTQKNELKRLGAAAIRGALKSNDVDVISCNIL